MIAYQWILRYDFRGYAFEEATGAWTPITSLRRSASCWTPPRARRAPLDEDKIVKVYAAGIMDRLLRPVVIPNEQAIRQLLKTM